MKVVPVSLNKAFFESVFSDLKKRQEKLEAVTKNLTDFFNYAVEVYPAGDDTLLVCYSDFDDYSATWDIAIHKNCLNQKELKAFSVELHTSGEIVLAQYYHGNRQETEELHADSMTAEEIVSKILASKLARSTEFFVAPILDAAIDCLWTETLKQAPAASPAQNWHPPSPFIKKL